MNTQEIVKNNIRQARKEPYSKTRNTYIRLQIALLRREIKMTAKRKASIL